MKKTMKFIGLIAMAALLFSCEKKNIDTPVENPQETETPSDLSQLDPGKYLVSFGATIEDPYTKATMTIDAENGTIAFEDGDEVLVVSGEKTGTYVYGSSVFSPKTGTDAVPTGSGDICAYYPATAYTASSGDVTFKIPGGADNTDTLGDNNPMAAKLVISEGSASATFTNFCSILQVSITGNRTLKKVSLNNASTAIAQDSEYSVTWSEGVPSIATEATDKKAIEISSSATLNPTTPTVFYFILPAGTNLTGVSVTAYTTEEDNGGMSTYTISRGDWTPEKNQIYQMSFYAGLFSGGTGTSGDPYIIANARDFKHIDTYCTSGYGSLAASDFLGAYYQQTADIDFKEVKMSPIGDSDHRFSGTYDGNGKQLLNVNINETGQFAGVFAYVEGENAIIKGLTVSGSVTKTENTSNSCVGAIAGIVRGAAKVTDCTNNAKVTSFATYTGGIVGRLYNSTAEEGIYNCTNNGEVIVHTPYAGGIVGQQTGGGTISGCTNTGNISGTEAVGGIVGNLVTGTIGSNAGTPTTAEEGTAYAEKGCANTGEINGERFIGGIVGRMDNGLVSICRNAGDVTCTDENAGGIVGYLRGGTVRLCYSKNAITISGPHQVGGLVGYAGASSPIVIINSSSKSNVTSTAYVTDYHGAAGGLIGHMKSTSSNTCVLANSVAWASNVMNTANANAYVGGIVGRINGASKKAIVRNCYSMHNGAANSTNGLLGYKLEGAALTFGSYCGGVFGYLENGEVDDCYWTKVNLVNSAGKQTSTANDKSVTNVKDMTNAAKNGTDKFATTTNYKNGRNKGTQYLYEHLRRGSFSASDGADLFSYKGFTTESSCAWDTKAQHGVTSGNKTNAIPVAIGYLPMGVDGWWQE